MKTMFAVAVILTLTSGGQAYAQVQRCSLSADDRNSLVDQALRTYGTSTNDKRDLPTHYHVTEPDGLHVDPDSGEITVAYDERDTLDGSTLRVVIAPCSKRVLSIEEHQDNIVLGSEFPVKNARTAISIGKQVCQGKADVSQDWGAELDTAGKEWSAHTIVHQSGDFLWIVHIPVTGPMPLACIQAMYLYPDMK